ncbi:hypothetical protein GWE18_15910 [Bradyrhizobium sp. CSA112]|uniref:hypothetical protein n=1 Tax=Bradyrhizobium sp. CSA112 TaxID=2699170 RepID=UPI0023AEA33D|nr:hypothetical protein [Bradyrhizobium sp. CSA112]MDE5454295.1 hypothetical protein [Bradyrhizobium sp. CSA112]
MVRSPQRKRAARPKQTISRPARKARAAKSNQRSRDGAGNGVFSCLGRSEANFSLFTLVSFLPRSAEIHPDWIAVIRGAHLTAPKSVAFGPLPTTATGKVQKFTLRERTQSL